MQHDEIMEAFGDTYRALDRQFAVPRTRWFDRIPYEWGWWWRYPYGLWLKLVAWWKGRR